MDKDAIKTDVKSYILAEFLPGEDPALLTSDVQLISDGILDSLAALKLVSFIEDKYGVQMQPHEINADYLDSLDIIADTVTNRRA